MIVFLGCLLKSYRYLQVLQLEHYYKSRYFLYVKRNYLYYNIIPFISLVGLFCFDGCAVLKCIFVAFYFIFLSLATIPSVIRLKFTNRILRIYLFMIMMLVGVFFVPSIFQVIYFLLFEFLLIIPLVINYPIDKAINKKYLKNSKIKYDSFKGYRLAVTGSYGKTSTKNLINDVLKNKLVGSCSYKSYNTVLGISRYINDIPLEIYDYILLEFGASHVGDIRELTTIYPIDIACVTEIGYMHLDTFKSIDNIILEKMSICHNAKVCILNYENEYIRNYAVDNVVSYGFNYGDYRASDVSLDLDGSSFKLFYKGVFIDDFFIPLLGNHQVLNSLCAIAVARYLNIDYEDIKKSLLDVKGVEHRLNLIKYDNYQLLDDSYNANIKGSIYALDVLGKISNYGVLITPGFVENTKVLNSLYERFAKKIMDVKPIVIFSNDYQTKYLQKILRDNDYEFIIRDSFKDAFEYFKLNYGDHFYTVLVENDLPDNYKKV